MNNLKAITNHTSQWLEKCSRTSTFNVITDDGFKYESHNSNKSFFEGSQHAKPHKKTQPKSIDQEFQEIIRLLESVDTKSFDDNARLLDAHSKLVTLRNRVDFKCMEINYPGAA